MPPTDLHRRPAKLELPAKPESVAKARQAARDFAQQCGADSTDVALAVSEAVTNAIVHGYRRTESGTVAICAEITANERLVVVVADDGTGLSAPSPHKGLGLGLPLIGSVAESVESTSGRNGGVEMRMRFDCRAQQPRHSTR